jgi:hypothetical protein
MTGGNVGQGKAAVRKRLSHPPGWPPRHRIGDAVKRLALSSYVKNIFTYGLSLQGGLVAWWRGSEGNNDQI